MQFVDKLKRMPQDRLTEYLRRRAGDYLRGVVQYDDESFEVIYVRDGLSTDAFHQRVAHIHNSIIERPTPGTEAESFGKPYATLSVREHAVVLNLRWNSDEGLLVGLEPDAARDLVAFIDETMEHGLPEGSPTSS